MNLKQLGLNLEVFKATIGMILRKTIFPRIVRWKSWTTYLQRSKYLSPRMKQHTSMGLRIATHLVDAQDALTRPRGFGKPPRLEKGKESIKKRGMEHGPKTCQQNGVNKTCQEKDHGSAPSSFRPRTVSLRLDPSTVVVGRVGFVLNRSNTPSSGPRQVPMRL